VRTVAGDVRPIGSNFRDGHSAKIAGSWSGDFILSLNCEREINVKKIRYAILAVLLITVCWQVAAGAAQPNVTPHLSFDTLVREHPRLMLKEDALRDLKEQAKDDEVLLRFVHEVIRRASDRLDDRPLLYKKRGPRLLHVSKSCVERIYDLGIAWRWTGEKKYAEKIKENLLAVCDFPDWNPSHFLDTAEMSGKASSSPPECCLRRVPLSASNRPSSHLRKNATKGSAASSSVCPKPRDS